MQTTAETSVLALERKPGPGLELELELQRLSERGWGEATLLVRVGPEPQPRRYSVVVREALPGERVRLRVVRRKRRTLEAALVAVQRPAPQRQQPRCLHFGPQAEGRRGCGGCVLQTVSHGHQLELKHAYLQRLFQQAKLDPELLRPPLAPRDPWYYRNKMEYSFARTPHKPFGLGLHPWGHHREVLALSECHLLSEKASALLPRFAEGCEVLGLAPYQHREDRGWLRTLTIREGKRSQERMVILTTSGSAMAATREGERPAPQVAEQLAALLRQLADDQGLALNSIYWTQQVQSKGARTRMVDSLLYGAPALHEELQLQLGETRRTLRFEIAPRAFFQPNTLQAEVLYQQVLQAAALDGEERGGLVLDLYCGTGTIGLCAAAFCAEVIGVELEPTAVENAARNALFNHIENIRFFSGDVGQLLKGELGSLCSALRCVIVDPPRSGLSMEALDHIGRMRSPRLVYVSCGPEALARDLIALRHFGLEPQYVQPVDMFPHTAHIENVALLQRR